MSIRAALVYREDAEAFYVVCLKNGGFVYPPSIFAAGRKLSIYYQKPETAKEIMLLPQPICALQYLPKPCDVPPDFPENIVDSECCHKPFVRRSLYSVLDWFLEECDEMGNNEWSSEDMFLYDAYGGKNYWQWTHRDFHEKPIPVADEEYSEYSQGMQLIQRAYLGVNMEDGFVGLFPENICEYLAAVYEYERNFYLQRPKLMKKCGETRKTIDKDYELQYGRVEGWLAETTSPKGDTNALCEYLRDFREQHGIPETLAEASAMKYVFG